jgi:hypothetical protein
VKKFDVVICCDVLEHIEKDQVLDAICDIGSLANKEVFASISIVPSKHCLPDGRNVHVCVKPKSWWKALIVTSRVRWHIAWKHRWSVEMEEDPF